MSCITCQIEFLRNSDTFDTSQRFPDFDRSCQCAAVCPAPRSVSRASKDERITKKLIQLFRSELYTALYTLEPALRKVWPMGREIHRQALDMGRSLLPQRRAVSVARFRRETLGAVMVAVGGLRAPRYPRWIARRWRTRFSARLASCVSNAEMGVAARARSIPLEVQV